MFNEIKNFMPSKEAISSGFVKTLSDEVLLTYQSLDDLLSGEFYPGNYNPSREQAICLIYHAVKSAIRWEELHDAI